MYWVVSRVASNNLGGYWTPDIQSYVYNRLRTEAGASDAGARGLLSRWMNVEAPDGPASVNPTSGAQGVGQWLGSRLPGIAGNTNLDDQLSYAIGELNGPESKAGDALRAATNEAQGATGASMYERAAGYNGATGTDNFTDATMNKMGSLAVKQPITQYDAYGNPVQSQPSQQPSAPVTTTPPQSGAVPLAPSDDDLVSKYLAPTGTTPSTPSQADPDDALISKYLGAPAATTTPDATVGDRAAELRAATQPSAAPLPPEIFPGANAFENGLMGAIPVLGPSVNNAVDFVGSHLASVFNGQTPQQNQLTAQNQTAAIAAQNPTASAAGSVVGTVAPYLMAGPETLAGKALGVGADYGLGSAGNMVARMAAGGTSGGLIQGADTLARGGTPQQAGQNALMGAAAGTAAPLIGGALGGPTALKTIAGGAALGGAVGAGGTLLDGGTPGEAVQNALTGAAVGGSVPAALRIAGGLAARLVSGGVPQATAELADAAVNKYGIQLSPAQISGNPLMKMADSVVNRLPLTGGTGSQAAQIGAFTKAIASEMGENASALTPAVMQGAKTRIGSVFQSVANNTPSIPEDNQLSTDLLNVMSGARNSVGDSQMKPIENTFNDIVSTFQNGGNSITGKQYLAMTAKGSPLDAAMNSSDPAIANAAGQFRDAIDGALQRSANPADLAALSQARYQWKVMRTIEDLAEKAPTGEISPALLMGAVRKSFPNMAYDGAGNMGELANIGQQFLKSPPNSGTPERGLVNKLLGLGEGAAGVGGALGLVMHPELLPQAAIGGAAYATAAPAIGAAMRSKSLANSLIQRGLGQPAPFNAATNMLTRSAAPLTAPLAGNALGGPKMVFRDGRWIPQITVGPANVIGQ